MEPLVPLGVLFALLQAVGFKAQELTERRIQEYGVSPIRTFALQRYALVPALLWAAIFVRSEDIHQLFSSPTLMGYILFMTIAWNSQSFMLSYLLNSMSSMTSLSTLWNIVYLPVLLVIGIFFNNDTPNVYSILAIVVLMAAFAVQPSQHEKNVRARFKMPLMIIIGLALFATLMDGANSAVSREALKVLRPEDFLAFFSIVTLALCWLWTSFFPAGREEAMVLKSHRLRAMALPLIWFAASIPESWAYAELPIYVVVSIGAITFAFDTVSDLLHKRIRFTLRTAGFIFLAVLGMGLAAYAA